MKQKLIVCLGLFVLSTSFIQDGGKGKSVSLEDYILLEDVPDAKGREMDIQVAAIARTGGYSSTIHFCPGTGVTCVVRIPSSDSDAVYLVSKKGAGRGDTEVF